MSRRRYAILMGAILTVFLALHLWFIFVAPTPWDWDEPVYSNIANQTLVRGYPAFQTYAAPLNYYAYQPPLHFYVLAWAYRVGGSSIVTGRIISSFAATLALGMAMLVILEATGDKQMSLLTGVLLCLDGWFQYSSLLVKLDTTAIMLGLTGTLFLIRAQKQGSNKLSALSGIFLGLATIYKHVSVVFLFAAVLLWIGRRRSHRIFVTTFLVAGIIIVLYVATMVTTVQGPFLQAMGVQIRRTLGLQEARGLGYGPIEALNALWQTYWAFAGTLVSLAFGLSTSFYRLTVKRKDNRDIQIILNLVVAASAILGVIALRNPHYLGLLIIPSNMMTAYLLVGWFRSVGGLKIDHTWQINVAMRTIGLTLLVSILALNVMTVAIRTSEFSRVNALQQAQQQVRKLDTNAVILSEEPICAMILVKTQMCFTLGNNQSSSKIKQIQPHFLVLYLTITQKPPQTGAVADLVKTGKEIMRIVGWKELVVLYEVHPPSPQ